MALRSDCTARLLCFLSKWAWPTVAKWFFYLFEDIILSPRYLRGCRTFLSLFDQKFFKELVFKAVENPKCRGYVDQSQRVRSIDRNLGLWKWTIFVYVINSVLVSYAVGLDVQLCKLYLIIHLTHSEDCWLGHVSVTIHRFFLFLQPDQLLINLVLEQLHYLDLNTAAYCLIKSKEKSS